MNTSSRRLQDLVKKVRACELCQAHLPLGPRPVLQIGEDARILIVGQAPGLKVHETGIPFNDVSGQRLRDWLGLTRDVFYDPNQVALLPMGFCYPGRGNSGDLPPRPECAEAWRAPLLATLRHVRLTLLLGQYALAYHWPQPTGGTAGGAGSVTGGKSQGRVRLGDAVADWRRCWPTLVPMPHPSPRNQLWLKSHPWFEAELLPTLRKRVQEVLR